MFTINKQVTSGIFKTSIEYAYLNKIKSYYAIIKYSKNINENKK